MTKTATRKSGPFMDDYADIVRQAQSTTDTAQRHAAFNELVGRFQGMAFHHAYNTLHDSHLAEDVTQEAFLTAYERLDQLREPAAFPGWLRRIVWTQCDRITRRNHPQTVPFESRWDLAADSPAPEDSIAEREIIDRVQVAVQSLPDHERAVTEGFYFNGESQKELAERLEVPVTTIKKRLQYARQHLRGIIAGLNETLDRLVPSQTPQRQYQPVYVRKDEDIPPTDPTDWY